MRIFVSCIGIALALPMIVSARAVGDTIIIKRLPLLGVEQLLANREFRSNPDLRVFSLNGDGLDDFVARYADGTVLIGLATGSPADPTNVLSTTSIVVPEDLGALFAGDCDRDAFKELFARVTGGVAVINDAASATPGTPTVVIPGDFIDHSQAMAAADVDGDGDDDVIALRTASAGNPAAMCLVYRNDTLPGQHASPGNFVQTDTLSLPPPLQFPEEFTSVSMGLINGDLFPDTLLVCNATQGVYLLAGIGDGTFDPIDAATGAVIPGGSVQQGIIDVGTFPGEGVIEDLDLDGFSDLVVLRGGDQSTVRFGNGNGTFDPSQFFGVAGMQNIVTGDVNDDWTKDIITLINVAGAVDNWARIAVTLVNPNQTLQPTQTQPTLHRPTSASLLTLEPGGPPQLLVGGDSKVLLHRNLGDGIESFQRIFNTTGGGARDIAVGDLTGDGYLDVYVTTFSSANRVRVNRGDGSGLLDAPLIPGQNAINAAPLAFVDRPAIGRGAVAFPQNGFIDSLVIGAVEDTGGGVLRLLYNTVLTMPDDARDIAAVDWNNDGFPEFALLHTSANPGVSVFRQQADGSFLNTPDLFDLSASSPAQGWWSKFAPFEELNKEGVAVTGPGGAGVYVESGVTLDFFQAFDATFGGGVNVTAGDLNADGRVDLVVGRDLGANAGALAVSIQNAGSPTTFAAPVTINLIGTPKSLDLGDVDNDNDLDIAAVCKDGSAGLHWTVILQNNGAGVFPPEDVTTSIAGNSPSRAILADLHNPASGPRGSASATAGPEVVIGGSGPDAFGGVQVLENIWNFAPPLCPGDADASGVVNFADVTSVLQFFGADYSPGTGPGDANHNGPVNFADVTSVLQFFGVACP